MSRRKHRPAALSCLAALAFAGVANAGPSCVAGDRNCGRAAFSAGTADFDRGDYAPASEWFRAAEAAEPHPVITFNLALCYARLGKPLAADAELGRLLADPKLDAALRARAEAERTNVLAQLAHLSVETPAPGTYVIEVDGERAPLDSSERTLDPGVHHIRIVSGTNPVYEQDVTMQPGERLRLRVTSSARSIDVVVVPPAPVPAGNVALKSPAPETASERRGLPPVVFYAAAGATVALGAVTIWSALDVRRSYNDYKTDLPRLTQAEADARVDDGHGRETRTNVLLAATAVSATATTLLGLLWVDFKPKTAARVTGAVTPFGAVVSGRF